MSSDSEEMRSTSGSPTPMEQPECTDSSSESRTTPEPTDEEKAQRQLLELSLAKCFANSALSQLNSQRQIPVYPHKVSFGVSILYPQDPIKSSKSS